MNMNSVERWYNRRFWLLLILVVMSVVWCGSLIVEPLLTDDAVKDIFYSLRSKWFNIFWLFIVCMNLWMLIAMKKNPELKEVLYDELFRQKSLEAHKWGLYAAFSAAATFPFFRSLPVQSLSFIVVLAGLLGMAIPMLIYMKR